MNRIAEALADDKAFIKFIKEGPDDLELKFINGSYDEFPGCIVCSYLRSAGCTEFSVSTKDVADLRSGFRNHSSINRHDLSPLMERISDTLNGFTHSERKGGVGYIITLKDFREHLLSEGIIS